MIIWIDTETTGLDCDNDFIVQIGALGVGNDYFNEIIKPPYFPDNYNVDVSKITGLTREHLEHNGLSQREAFELFTDWLKKYVRPGSKKKLYLGGKNVGFDRGFLDIFFKQNGEELYKYFYNPIVDVDTLIGRLDSLGVISLDGRTLTHYADLFRVELKAHDAYQDIKATKEIFEKAEKMLVGYYGGNNGLAL